MIGNILGGLFSKIVDNAEGILDEVITTDEERDKAKLALQKLLLDAEREAFAKEVEDRKDARSLYKDDAIIQKILATLFTAAYFGLTYIMFRYFVLNTIELSDYEIGFISTVFGAMSSKVNTIIDFSLEEAQTIRTSKKIDSRLKEPITNKTMKKQSAVRTTARKKLYTFISYCYRFFLFQSLSNIRINPFVSLRRLTNESVFLYQVINLGVPNKETTSGMLVCVSAMNKNIIKARNIINL